MFQAGAPDGVSEPHCRQAEISLFMSSPRVVVTGKQGQLARSLIELGRARGIEVVAVGRPVLELTEPATIEPAIAALKPDVVVNAAGYTDTERAESEPEITHAVNVAGAGAVAACARKLGVPLIHLSSAYVFDGQKPDPYRETDATGPLGAYGQTKALGEAAVAAAEGDHVILRTSLVFSPFGRNTLTNLLKRAERQDEIRIVADQLVNPTAAANLADGILAVARNLTQGPRNAAHYGLFHLTSTGVATPAEFATALFAYAVQCGGPLARVVPITSAEFVSRVRRPPNARLDCSKIASVHGITLPPWEPALRTCVERIFAKTE
jgi:dTDP-4-dehydrorhamnose reductase